MKKSTKNKEAPAENGGARNAARDAAFVEADFVRAMETAAVGALSAAGVCFAQASASSPTGSRRAALEYFSKIALMFAKAVRVVDDEEGLAVAAKLAAELDAAQEALK